MKPLPHTKDEDCTLDPDAFAPTCGVCGVSHANMCESCGGAGYHKDGCIKADPPEVEEDWTDETFVLGAVLAQLEDLDRDAKIRVLNEARRQVEETR